MTTFNDNYFSGQGKIYIAKRDPTTGNPLNFYYMGNVPKLEAQYTATRRKHQESTSGQRLTDRVQSTTKEGRLALTLEDVQKKNLALLMAGNTVSLASGSFASASFDVFPSALVVGDIVKLAKPNATSFVLKDSAGSPATLVFNTDYAIIDAGHGLVQILNLSTYTQPFKAQYSYAATDAVTAYTADDDTEYYVYFAGINTEADPDQRIGADFYRCVFDPGKSLNLISADQGTFDLEAEILRDNVKAADANFGGFARIVYVDPNL